MNLSTVVADWRINDIDYSIERTENKSNLKHELKVIQFDPGTKETGPKMISNYPVHCIETYFTKYLRGMLREIFIWFGGTKPAPHKMWVKVS